MTLSYQIKKNVTPLFMGRFLNIAPMLPLSRFGKEWHGRFQIPQGISYGTAHAVDNGTGVHDLVDFRVVHFDSSAFVGILVVVVVVVVNDTGVTVLGSSAEGIRRGGGIISCRGCGDVHCNSCHVSSRLPFVNYLLLYGRVPVVPFLALASGGVKVCRMRWIISFMLYFPRKEGETRDSCLAVYCS